MISEGADRVMLAAGRLKAASRPKAARHRVLSMEIKKENK